MVCLRPRKDCETVYAQMYVLQFRASALIHQLAPGGRDRLPGASELTHLPLVPLMSRVNIGSDNGLSPIWCQAIF